MSEDDAGPHEARGSAGRALKSTMAWTAAAVALLLTLSVALEGWRPFWSLAAVASEYTGEILSFAAVAGGVQLARSRVSRLRVAAVAGVVVAVGTYLMSAVVTPLMEYVAFAWWDRYAIELFGIQTPDGILRRLEYVLANPPAEYSLSAEHPDRAYPARLVFFFNLPMAMAATGLVNTFVGLFLGRATSAMHPRARRRTRCIVGLAGAVALVVAILLAHGPDRDWENISGVVAAWVPLLVPAVLLGILILVAHHRTGLRSGRADVT